MFSKNDTVDEYIRIAARSMARAIVELRERGSTADCEYAAVLRSHLDGLERKHTYVSDPQPVLPALPGRSYSPTHVGQ